jgi:branched-chain amino acid transport system substrate-binding protein
VRRPVTVSAAGLAALTLGLAGCGSSQNTGYRIPGRTLTIYASVPLNGPSAVTGMAVLRGERMALAASGGRIGSYRIVLKALDDATVARGSWDPGQTTVNARVAVADPTTIGYLGNVNSGASAISIPLLNRAEIPQISPSSTAVGLTSAAVGAAPGEPQKYYPTGVRTYARVIPNDAVQAQVQVKAQQRADCRRTFVLDDGEVDGEDTAMSFELAARAAGLTVTGAQAFPRGATDYSSLAASVAQTRADCVLISAIPDSGAVLLTTQVAAALPNATIFGTAAVAQSSYTDPSQGGIPHGLDPRVLITAAALDGQAYPPAGRAFLAEYRQHFGAAQPAAIFGYEAMSLMLGAIHRATDGGTKPANRSKVLAAIFSTRERRSAVGSYSIDRNGDTSLRTYGLYRVVDGHLTFWKAIDG